MSGTIQHRELNCGVSKQMWDDGWHVAPIGSFHVGFCHKIIGATIAPFDTENWRYMCESMCVFMRVWTFLSDLPAVLFFLFMIGCVSANLLLIHHPAVTGLGWLDTAHTSSCKYDLSPKAWFIQALTRLQSSVAQYHTQTNTHTHRSVFEWIYCFDLCQRSASNSTAPGLLEPSSLITKIKLSCDVK